VITEEDIAKAIAGYVIGPPEAWGNSERDVENVLRLYRAVAKNVVQPLLKQAWDEGNQGSENPYE